MPQPDRDDDRGLLKLSGALLAAGFVLLALVTKAFHPSHHENEHHIIFGKYADSDAWVAVHFGQFVAVLIALGGFLVLHRYLEARNIAPALTRLALGATIATAAVWAVLQAVDGTALKQASDAWSEASGTERDLRFADAEAVRWTEWGLQSYFRLLMGLVFVLFGTALGRARVIAPWAAGAGVLAGLLYIAIGIAVGHTGFEKPGGPLVQVLMLMFVAGVVTAARRGAPRAQAAFA